MSEQQFCRLDERKLVKISGSEAEVFLQGIFTCNIEEIPARGAGFGGLLSPQGKILFDFFVVRDGEKFLLDIDTTMVDEFVKRLAFYKLRADVQLDVCGDEIEVFAVWGGTIPNVDSALIIADPRLPEMGWRIYSNSTPQNVQMSPSADYEKHRITLGMPKSGVDYLPGGAFPHDALYDQNGGVDFSKGCYVGQEVVSRMHHRGSARKRVIQIMGDEQLPQPGTKITVEGKSVGEITSLSGKLGMAIARIDRIGNAVANSTPVMAGNVSLKPIIQSWVNFDWPGE
jgi:folate-binding protein YgfZ